MCLWSAYKNPHRTHPLLFFSLSYFYFISFRCWKSSLRYNIRTQHVNKKKKKTKKKTTFWSSLNKIKYCFFFFPFFWHQRIGFPGIHSRMMTGNSNKLLEEEKRRKMERNKSLLCSFIWSRALRISALKNRVFSSPLSKNKYQNMNYL